MTKILFSALVCFSLLLASGSAGVAQKPQKQAPTKPAKGAKGKQEPPPPAPTLQISAEERAERLKPFADTMFFTAEELLLIKRAERGVATSADGKGGSEVIPPVRKIRLAGILYFAPDQWMIWLNGKKVTPWVQPKEIQEIKVNRDTIDLKWFDKGANYTIHIPEMPANSEYDIVTGILLTDQTPAPASSSKQSGARRR